MPVSIKNISISQYIFPEDTNPFVFNADPKRSTDKIAEGINGVIGASFGADNLLIRGIQSGKYSTTDRDALLASIVSKGSDGYSEETDGRGILFAAPYAGLRTIEVILSGFHEFKPKCEERPQYPIDIWMVFDQAAFENIAYLHPRHNVIANDKWQVRDESLSGLMGIVIVN